MDRKGSIHSGKKEKGGTLVHWGLVWLTLADTLLLLKGGATWQLVTIGGQSRQWKKRIHWWPCCNLPHWGLCYPHVDGPWRGRRTDPQQLPLPNQDSIYLLNLKFTQKGSIINDQWTLWWSWTP
jgi:hypothetical protein